MATATTPQRILLSGLCVTIALSVCSTTLAIGVRHDIASATSDSADNPYVALGAQFDAVVNISWSNHRGSFQGTGTLIQSTVPGEYKILTAAHNIDGRGGTGAPDGLIDASQFTIEFGDDIAALTHRVDISKNDIVVHPRWAPGDPAGTGLLRGAAQFDLAVLSFSENDLSLGYAETLPNGRQLWGGNPLDQIVTSVGYGRWGLGDEFIGLKDGIRRAGTNVVDAFDAFSAEPNDGITLRSDFDAGSSIADRSVSGYDGLLQPLESSTALGDSGGPLLTLPGRDLVVGVLHGGYNHFPDADISEYGDVGVWAAVGEPLNRQFLELNGLAYHEFAFLPSPVAVMAVPEPTNANFACSLFVVLFLRQRRQHTATNQS